MFRLNLLYLFHERINESMREAVTSTIKFQMNRYIVMTALLATATAGWGSAADFACTGQPPAVRGITLGMTLTDVRSRLGSGVLVNRSPDPDAERQFYYAWRLGSAKFEVVFDQAMKAVLISVGSKSRYAAYANVVLNQDTIGSVERKFGLPGSKVGPMFGEGEYAFYSLAYHCGPGSQQEVLFSSQVDCTRPDMQECLSENIFTTRPIVKVTVRKRDDVAAK